MWSAEQGRRAQEFGLTRSRSDCLVPRQPTRILNTPTLNVTPRNRSPRGMRRPVESHFFLTTAYYYIFIQYSKYSRIISYCLCGKKNILQSGPINLPLVVTRILLYVLYTVITLSISRPYVVSKGSDQPTSSWFTHSIVHLVTFKFRTRSLRHPHQLTLPND